METREHKREKALDLATRDARRIVGDTLTNGAILLASNLDTEQAYFRSYTVLALARGSDPFVVWTRQIGIAEDSRGEFIAVDYCLRGEYFTSLPKALSRYNERKMVARYNERKMVALNKNEAAYR